MWPDLRINSLQKIVRSKFQQKNFQETVLCISALTNMLMAEILTLILLMFLWNAANFESLSKIPKKLAHVTDYFFQLYKEIVALGVFIREQQILADF